MDDMRCYNMVNADDHVAGHVKTSHYYLNPFIIKQYQSNHVMLNDARLGKPSRLNSPN